MATALPAGMSAVEAVALDRAESMMLWPSTVHCLSGHRLGSPSTLLVSESTRPAEHGAKARHDHTRHAKRDAGGHEHWA